MLVADIIRQKLTDALAPLELEVIDESHKHAGHAGANPLGESHFSVKIVSSAFEGKSRIECQRMVYQVLAEEMSGRIHALSLQTLVQCGHNKT